jgi:hypothetical protein
LTSESFSASEVRPAAKSAIWLRQFATLVVDATHTAPIDGAK